MSGHVNDFLRSIISWAILIGGLVSNCLLRFRMAGYARKQKRLNA